MPEEKNPKENDEGEQSQRTKRPLLPIIIANVKKHHFSFLFCSSPKKCSMRVDFADIVPPRNESFN